MLAKQWSLMPESRIIRISDLLENCVWNTNGFSLGRLSTPFVASICSLGLLELGGGLSSGLWLSWKVEVMSILKLVSPIVAQAKTWSLSSLWKVAFAVGDGLKFPCQVLVADPLIPSLFPKPGKNCPFLLSPGQ